MRTEYHSEVSLSSFQVSSKEEALRRTMSGEVYKRTFSKTVTMRELVGRIQNGFIVIPSEFDGEGFKKKNWLSSDYIFIDVDDAHNVDFSTLPESLKPSFIYTTLSHTEQSGRYRMGYYLSETQDDVETYESLIRGLLKVLKEHGINGDSQCSNANRIYFPSKEVLYVDYDRILDIDLIEAVDPVKIDFSSDGYITDNPIVKALANKDIKTLKKLVDVEISDDFDNMEFFEKINSIKISEFFQVPIGENFSDFFTEDANPSASVFKAKYSEVYKSFNTGLAMSFIELVSKIADTTIAEAIKIVEQVLRVEIASSYQRKMREAVSFHKSLIKSELAKHEELYAFMKRSNLISFYMLLLDIAQDKITSIPLNGENKLTFFASRDHIVELNLEFYNVRGANVPGTVMKKINLLAEIGLLEKEKEIKNELVQKKAENYRKQGNFRYRINFLSFDLGGDALAKANVKVIERKNKNMRNKMTGTKQLMSAQGIKETGRVYSQSDMDKISQIVDKEQKIVLQLGNLLIERNGYFTEKMMEDSLVKHKFTRYRARQLAGTYREFLTGYFDFVTATWKIIEELKLEGVKPRMKIYLNYK